MKTFLPRLANRVLDTPLLIHPDKLHQIIGALNDRLSFNINPALFSDYKTQNKADNMLFDVNGNIAVIQIHGTLVKKSSGIDAESGLLGYPAIEEMFLSAINDSSVEGVLFDIDSAGGESGGVFDLAKIIYELRGKKPIWAYANLALSSAYLIASAADKIIVPETGRVGSIGVYAVHIDQSEANKKAGRDFSYIYAGDKKIDQNPHAPLSDSARQSMQDGVDRLYNFFVRDVAVYRKISSEAIRNTEAAVLFGESAIEVGLADQVLAPRAALQALSLFAAKQMRLDMSNSKDKKKDSQSESSGSSDAKSVAMVPKTSLDAMRKKLQAHAQVITDLCAIANKPQLAGKFIASGKTEEQVRAYLIEDAAKSSGDEIHTHTTTTTGTEEAADSNLDQNIFVVQARKMAEAQQRA